LRNLKIFLWNIVWGILPVKAQPEPVGFASLDGGINGGGGDRVVHNTVGLFGSSVDDSGDVKMKVTYYRNCFDSTHSRHPRTRYEKAHVLNNQYADIAGYDIGSTCQAQVMVEGNYIENTSVVAELKQSALDLKKYLR
jgi:pectate lyase